MPEMKTLNGYEIVDAKAREDIADLQENSAGVKTHYFGAVQSFSALTDKDKEVLTYVISQVVAYKEPSEYLLYYRMNNNAVVFLLDYFAKDFSSNYVSLVGHSSGGYTITLKVGYNSSTYAPTSFSSTYASTTPTVPTKTSDLTNDSGYQTATQVQTLIDTALGVIENGSY